MRGFSRTSSPTSTKVTFFMFDLCLDRLNNSSSDSIPAPPPPYNFFIDLNFLSLYFLNSFNSYL